MALGSELDFYWALNGTPTWHAKTITGGGVGLDGSGRCSGSPLLVL